MRPTLRDIEWAVATKYNLTREDMRGLNRKRKVARPRQIAMFLARTVGKRSYPEIGRWFNRDHTTAIHAEQRIVSLMETSEKVRDHVAECRAALPCMASREAQIKDAVEAMVASGTARRVKSAIKIEAAE